MKCPICNRDEGKKRFGVYIFCGQCKSLYLENPPSSATLRVENKKYANSVIAQIDTIKESLILPLERLSLLGGKLQKKSKILDVGCGYGLFLDLVLQADYVPYGMDVAFDFIRYLRKKKIPGYTNMKDVPDNYFDAITAFDVIEHIRKPQQWLIGIKKKLKKNGYIMLSTPNLLGISGRVLRHRWWVLSPDGHFTLFSPNSLRSILERNGFEVIQCKTNSITQWFVPNDSFLKKIANKILYTSFSMIKKVLFSHNLMCVMQRCPTCYCASSLIFSGAVVNES